MKRTTIYLDSALELRLKMEGRRRKQPMAEIVREAVEAYLDGGPTEGPPGAGAFASGRRGQRTAPKRSLPSPDSAARGRSPSSGARSGARECPARYRDRLRVHDRSDRWHRRARALLQQERRGLILPAPVIPGWIICWDTGLARSAVSRSTRGSRKGTILSRICLDRRNACRGHQPAIRGSRSPGSSTPLSWRSPKRSRSHVATTDRRHFVALAPRFSLELLP
jgi:hypothetical protein